VDILVLNNGGPPGTSAAALTSAAIASAATDSLLAHLDLVGATLPAMREQGWGRIIAIGSSGVREPIPGLALSNTLRAALAGYLKTLAGEVAAEGVTVNMVLPGRFATPRVHDLDAETARRTGEPVAVVAARSAAGIPTGRYGTPAEFAAVVAFLSSAAAGYVTGTQVRVDGGMARGW
jgi:3-oxoacyl-[acyl-carrier protein] reductase